MAYPLSRLPRVTVYIGDELPVLPLWWTESGTLIDFGTELSTFTLTATAETDLDANPEVHAFVKTSNIVGVTGDGDSSSGTPNVTVAWANSGDLNDLPAAGDYLATLTAARLSDSAERSCQFVLVARNRFDG